MRIFPKIKIYNIVVNNAIEYVYLYSTMYCLQYRHICTA